MVSNTKMRAKINRAKVTVADFGKAVPIWDAYGRGYGLQVFYNQLIANWYANCFIRYCPQI